MRSAILTGCHGVINKHFAGGWELLSDEICTALSQGDIETTESILSLGVDIKTKRPEDPSFLEAAIWSEDQNTINWALAADPGYYDPSALCAAVKLALKTEPILCYRDVLTRRPEALVADIIESTAVGIAASGNNMQLLRDLLLIIPPSPYCLMDEEKLFQETSLGETLFNLHSRRNKKFPALIFNEDRTRCLRGSPLTYAVGVGREEFFSLMLESGYQPDESTLFRAIVVGSLEQIKFICGSGLGDLVLEDPSRHSTPTRKIPLTISSLIQTAAKWNRTDVVQWLLAQGSSIREWTDYIGRSPLQSAVRYGNCELVKILLKHGVYPNEKPGKFEMTALQLAAREGYIGIAKILVNHDPPADVNAYCSDRLLGGYTALEAASYFGRLDMVQFLLCNGVKTEGTGREQYIRAIKYARIANHPEIVNILKAHREGNQQGEESLENESLQRSYNVQEPERSHFEYEFSHKDTCLELGDRDAGEDGCINDDSGLFLVNNNFAEENRTNGFLEGTSVSWGEVMTLEEAEEAFISYKD